MSELLADIKKFHEVARAAFPEAVEVSVYISAQDYEGRLLHTFSVNAYANEIGPNARVIAQGYGYAADTAIQDALKNCGRRKCGEEVEG